MQRQTRQRTAIQTAIRKADRPISVEEIQERAQTDVKSLGIATVYRALKGLLDEGEIRKVDIPGQAPHYERADLDHHHHFYCEDCNQVFEIEDCPPGIHHLAPTGFRVKRHEITLFGQCDDCGTGK